MIKFKKNASAIIIDDCFELFGTMYMILNAIRGEKTITISFYPILCSDDSVSRWMTLDNNDIFEIVLI